MNDFFKEGLEKLSPWLLSHGVRILIIVVGAYILNKVLARFIIRAVRITVVQDGISGADAEKKREDTLIQIFCTTARIGIYATAFMMVLQEVGVQIGPILAGAGIIGLALGFGGQYLIRDVITGLFIILENQYRVGDVIEFDTVGGVVEKITLRMTTLRNLDGTVHHVPHGEIKRVSNKSKIFARVNLDIGVSYSADLDHVIRVINKVGSELAEDEKWKEYILKAPQFLRVDNFADSSVVVKIVGETLPHRQWEVTGELRKRIKAAFDSEGIEIPFPQRVIYNPKQ